MHSHTTRSDGKDTPKTLIDNAVAAGIKILAITDHDIIAPDTIEVDCAEVDLVAYGAEKGIVVLPGIEFSCETNIEDVHIIALGCRWKSPFFEQQYRDSIQSKIESYRKLCDQLTQQGMPIDYNQDILLHGLREKEVVQRKHIFETMANKGYASDWSKAKLLVKNTASLRVRRCKPNAVDIIAGIHRAGGIAILAHPYLIAEDHTQINGNAVSRAEYIDHLIQAGLDGIEASYPYDKTSYDGTLSSSQIEVEVSETYRDRLTILSGGSDYHAEEKSGAVNPRILGEKGVSLEYFYNNPKLYACVR